MNSCEAFFIREKLPVCFASRQFSPALCFAIVILSLITLAACDSTKDIIVHESKIKGTVGNSSGDKGEAAANNTRHLQEIVKNELEFYTEEARAAGRPLRCLALSGGGIRSAAYSIGVMKALHHKGLLEKIDIISSVSGGAYATGWLYAQLGKDYYQSMDELFNPLSPAEKDGRNRLAGEVTDGRESRFVTVIAAAGPAVSTLAMVPVNTALNGVFRFKANVTPARNFYMNRLDKKFQSKDLGVVNPGKAPEYERKLITTRDLKKFLRERASSERLPFFIINATASRRFVDVRSLSEASNQKPRPAEIDKIFEITPTRIGSMNFGYAEDSGEAAAYEPFSLPLAVSISGAAFDTSVSLDNNVMGKIMPWLNFDLGYYIDNYQVANDVTLNKYRFSKFIPLIGHVHYSLHPEQNPDIYLTDGGHSENLGLYSLIQRHCDEIIVVDAEYEANKKKYEFGALKNVSLALEKMNMKMEVCEAIKAFNDDVGKKPVLLLEVSGYDIAQGNQINSKPLKITYIKLSVNKNEAENGNYGRVVQCQIADQSEQHCDKRPDANSFPERTTADQNFDPIQFNAFRDLGCRTAEIFLNDKGTLKDGVSYTDKSTKCYGEDWYKWIDNTDTRGPEKSTSP